MYERGASRGEDSVEFVGRERPAGGDHYNRIYSLLPIR